MSLLSESLPNEETVLSITDLVENLTCAPINNLQMFEPSSAMQGFSIYEVRPVFVFVLSERVADPKFAHGAALAPAAAPGFPPLTF